MTMMPEMKQIMMTLSEMIIAIRRSTCKKTSCCSDYLSNGQFKWGGPGSVGFLDKPWCTPALSGCMVSGKVCLRPCMWPLRPLKVPRVLSTRRGTPCETEGGQLPQGGCQPSQEDESWKVEGSNHKASKVFHLKISIKWLLAKSPACSTLNCVCDFVI